ncbi:MAG: hypothetical protein D6734_13210, partial [Candidatus Schekmanbacteria bacterium]
MNTSVLIIFTRFPVAGETKTRLIPAVGAEGAAKLHKKMAERVIASARRFRGNNKVKIEIHYEGGNGEALKE